MAAPVLPDDLGRLIVSAVDHYARELTARYANETVERRRSIPLAMVAEENGMSLRRLTDACRQGRFAHVHDGGYRGMTPEQITEMLDKLTVGTRSEAPEPVSSLDQARQASRRSARRQPPRRVS